MIAKNIVLEPKDINAIVGDDYSLYFGQVENTQIPVYTKPATEEETKDSKDSIKLMIDLINKNRGAALPT